MSATTSLPPLPSLPSFAASSTPPTGGGAGQGHVPGTPTAGQSLASSSAIAVAVIGALVVAFLYSKGGKFGAWIALLVVLGLLLAAQKQGVLR